MPRKCFIDRVMGPATMMHFSAACIVGYVDSLEEANKVHDEHRVDSGLTVDGSGWQLTQ